MSLELVKEGMLSLRSEVSLVVFRQKMSAAGNTTRMEKWKSPWVENLQHHVLQE